MRRMLIAVVVVAGLSLVHAGELSIYQDIMVPEGWTRPEIVVQNGVVFYTPATPIFTKRRVGTELKVLNIHIRRFMVIMGSKIKTVEPGTVIRGNSGKNITLSDKKYHLIGGHLYRLVGRDGDKVIFKHLTTRNAAFGTLVSVPKKELSGESSGSDG